MTVESVVFVAGSVLLGSWLRSCAACTVHRPRRYAVFAPVRAGAIGGGHGYGVQGDHVPAIAHRDAEPVGSSLRTVKIPRSDTRGLAATCDHYAPVAELLISDRVPTLLVRSETEQVMPEGSHSYR
jgi:hypothetical protein